MKRDVRPNFANAVAVEAPTPLPGFAPLDPG